MSNNWFKVLLVEDNPEDVQLVDEMLSESDISGFVLERADRISAGLERLSRKDIDVVLLSLSLPDSQGLDTLQKVVLAAPKVPIVVMNSLDDDEDLALQAVQGGAQDYIVKGYMDTHALTRAIRYAIERKRSEEELRRVNRALKTLSDCNQVLIRATDEASLLHKICKTLVATGGYRMAWVGYAERDEAKTVRQVACAGDEEGYLAALNITWADTESGRGPTGTAIRTGKVCKVNNILTNPSYTWRSNVLERGYADSIALPLIGNDGPFGALNIYAQEAGAFDEQEERLLRELADDLAYGIMAQRTHAERVLGLESLQKSEEKYRFLFNTMLDGFALHEIICDENGKPCDYRFLEVNPAFERMTGLKAAEIMGKTVLQVLPSIEAYWIATYGEVALSGISIRFANYAQSLKKYFDVLAFSPRRNQFVTLFTDVTERRKAEKVQEAVYKISQTLVSTASLKELYGSIHGILAELMPVDNFYIALYDPTSNLLNFAYFVDQYDQPPPPQKPGHGLTEYILRTGSPLLASPEIFAKLVQEGEVELVGTDSVDWLGVPLKVGGRVIGALVTQSYTEGIRFRQEEKDLLEFVSTQVALAIDRKRAEEALRESEERYRILAENTQDFIYSLDREGRYTAVNQSVCRAMNLPLEAIIGKNQRELGFPEAIIQEWEGMIRHVLLDGEVVRAETSTPMPDGEVRTYEVTLRPIEDPYGQVTGIRGVSHDISERKQAEEKNHRQFNRLAALREIDSAINSSLDMHLALNTILAQIATQLGIDAVNILLLDPRKQVLEYFVGRGFHTEALQHTHLRLGDSYAGRAALNQQIVHIPDLQGHKTDFLRSPTFSLEGFVCYFGVPLIAKGEVKGVLEVFHRSALHPDTEWLDFMETLAGQAAIAIDNRQLFDNLQHSNLELMQAYDATIEGWSQAMDLRDKETEGHTLRVTELTVRLAGAMDMSKDEIVLVRRGALLHDMGKLGVPDAILLKSGKLTNEELALMKQHPQFAYNMLSPIAYLRPALDIPYCHHEKWDGSGYPRRLKGEQIPLAARIFAVVDVWDALTSDRPYRKAWKETEALEYIRNQSGQHFDPKVVEVFLRVKPWMSNS
jgi:PAS domain S-box-containing protein